MWSALLVAWIVPSVSTIAAPQPGVFQVQIVADEMCCQGCAQKVAAQLYALPGVTAVDADVAQRLLTVTGKSSPKLTLERIWRAVEKAEGGPSKLVTSRATYTWTRPERLQAGERPSPGRYTLQVDALPSDDAAQSIADQLDRIPGVESVGVDIERSTLSIRAANDGVISPWAVVGAAERAHRLPVAVAGPFGIISIERASDAKTAATPRLQFPQNLPQPQGEVR
jgi:copper chaperone CopZ